MKHSISKSTDLGFWGNVNSINPNSYVSVVKTYVLCTEQPYATWSKYIEQVWAYVYHRPSACMYIYITRTKCMYVYVLHTDQVYVCTEQAHAEHTLAEQAHAEQVYTRSKPHRASSHRASSHTERTYIEQV